MPMLVDGGVGTARFEIPLHSIAKVEAVYPPELGQRGVEGFCEVLMDIDATGRTQNVRSGTCSNEAFAAPSVRAVEKFRYSPRITELGPQPTSRVRLFMVFLIED